MWRNHLRHALLQLPFGFMPFEQVYEVGPPTAGQEATDGLGEVAHLRKLGPRMPRSLSEAPRVHRDGGLAGITQYAPRDFGRPDHYRGDARPGEVFIPADRLVVYVNDQEAADWTGVSILRGSYGNWLIKDTLMRLGPMVVERNGMGVPVVYYAEGDGNQAKALKLATEFRAGAQAGAAVPDNMKVEILGVTGSTRDELPLMKYHDEAAGRASLAMFLNLGHDNGARSLGESFVDYFVLSLDAVADQIADTATEHIVRDLVEINFGADEAYPSLVPDAITAESTPTAEALKTLKDAGLLGPIDPDLQAEVRRRYGLPAVPEDFEEPEPPAAPFVPQLVPTLPGQQPGVAPVDDPQNVVGRLAALNERVLALHGLR